MNIGARRERDRCIGRAYRQATRRAVVLKYVRQEAQARRGWQEQRSGVARERANVDTTNGDPATADVVVVLPDALRGRIGCIAHDGKATKGTGRVAATVDGCARVGIGVGRVGPLVVGMVVVTKTQCSNGRTGRASKVFGGGRQGGCCGCRRIIDIAHRGADSAAGGVPGSGDAGAAVGGNVVGIGVAGADLARQIHAGIGQAHRQRAGCAKVVGRRHKANLAARTEDQRRAGAQAANRDVDPVARRAGIRSVGLGDLPDALPGHVVGRTNHRQVAKEAGRIATRDVSAVARGLVVRGIAVAKAQARQRRTRWRAHVFGERRQRDVAAAGGLVVARTHRQVHHVGCGRERGGVTCANGRDAGCAPVRSGAAVPGPEGQRRTHATLPVGRGFEVDPRVGIGQQQQSIGFTGSKDGPTRRYRCAVVPRAPVAVSRRDGNANRIAGVEIADAATDPAHQARYRRAHCATRCRRIFGLRNRQSRRVVKYRRVVGAGDGDGHRRACAGQTRTVVRRLDGVSQDQGLASGQVVEGLGARIEVPGQRIGGVGGVDDVSRRHAQHGQQCRIIWRSDIAAVRATGNCQ